MIESRNPKNVHKPLAPYSHQIEASGDIRWLTLSGQLGMDLEGKVPEDSVEQLKMAFENIRINLLEADMDVKKI